MEEEVNNDASSHEKAPEQPKEFLVVFETVAHLPGMVLVMQDKCEKKKKGKFASNFKMRLSQVCSGTNKQILNFCTMWVEFRSCLPRCFV